MSGDGCCGTSGPSQSGLSQSGSLQSGEEWLVEAHGCHPASLSNLRELQALFDDLVEKIDLHPVSGPAWHQFPVTGGITGLHLLAESHLACHTFPEYGSLCLNVFCCRPRASCDFDEILRTRFGAQFVSVRRLERQYALERAPA